MNLDVRLPIGLMFTLFVVVLAGYGLVSDSKIYVDRSLGLNINLYWGLVLLVFGAIMLVLVGRSKKP